MDYDFESELRGECDEVSNVKQSGIVQAVIVGIIVSVANFAITYSVQRGDAKDDRNDASIAALTTQVAELRTTVGALAKELGRLTDQPFVRREEFERGFSGLDRRITNLERAPVASAGPAAGRHQ